jgi:hypothetical protein
MAENYDLIFGSNASQTYAWSDSDYQTGWETVGDTPPTAQQFDALQNRADKKAQELNNRMIPLETAIGAYERQPSTGYSSGVAVLATGLNLPLYLECTTAGTTSAVDITIPSSPSVGSTIADGTVVWTIRKLVNTSNTSGYVTKDVTNLTYYKKKVDTPAFNTRAEITTSGTWTAPVTGWYKITLKGGGGGGQGGGYSGTSYSCGGKGGGEGGTTIRYKYMSAGTSCSIVIGAGGSGGATSTSGEGSSGSEGGSTTVTIGTDSYTAGGGKAGSQGGTGDIKGCPGGTELIVTGGIRVSGRFGGGAGGGVGHGPSTNAEAGVNGGGGAGGGAQYSSSARKAGAAGGNGYVWFEYWTD